MELDEFSALFNAQFDQQTTEKSADDISKRLHNRSGTALERIMRNLLVEVGVGVGAIILMAIVAYRIDSITIHWLSRVIYVLSIVQIVAFMWQYRQLQTMITPNVMDLRSHLQQQIQVVQRFINMYLGFCLWSIPIGFVLGGFLGYTIAANDLHDPLLRPLDDVNLSLTGVISVFIGVIAFLAGTYYLVKAYIRWLYGQHLDQLKSCLADLDR